MMGSGSDEKSVVILERVQAIYTEIQYERAFDRHCIVSV